METNNEEQFVEFDEILNFIHENTGFDKEVIEKVLDADTGEREQRTAYEVSVRLIRRKEEAERSGKNSAGTGEGTNPSAYAGH